MQRSEIKKLVEDHGGVVTFDNPTGASTASPVAGTCTLSPWALSWLCVASLITVFNLCIFFLSFCRATDVLYELAPHGTPGVSNQPLPTGEREPPANIVVTPQWVQRCIQVPRRTRRIYRTRRTRRRHTLTSLPPPGRAGDGSHGNADPVHSAAPSAPAAQAATQLPDLRHRLCRYSPGLSSPCAHLCVTRVARSSFLTAGVDRENLKGLIESMGFSYTDRFTKKNTHLICKVMLQLLCLLFIYLFVNIIKY